MFDFLHVNSIETDIFAVKYAFYVWELTLNSIFLCKYVTAFILLYNPEVVDSAAWSR